MLYQTYKNWCFIEYFFVILAPIPPRGNYQNVHDFLNAYHQAPSEESVNYNLKASTLPRSVESLPKESPPSRSSTMRFYDYMGKKRVIIELII